MSPGVLRLTSALGSFASAVALAGDLRVRVEAQNSSSVLAGEILAQRLDREDRSSSGVSKTLVAGSATLNLPPGAWGLRLIARGYWSEEKAVSVGEKNSTVELDAWPTGTITGSLGTEKGMQLPGALEAAFSATPEARAASGPSSPKGIVGCILEKEDWRCDLPAGVLDVQLRAKRFIPQFRWEVEIARGATKNLGKITFREGASVIGWVRAEEREAPDFSKVRVDLLPRLGASPLAPDDSRRKVFSLSVPVNKRGFFQFEGAAPGAYFVTARSSGWRSARQQVVVVENTQAEMRAPLFLSRPRTLQLRLEPRMDPWGKPWTVQFDEIQEVTEQTLPVVRSVAKRDGTWSIKGLPFGKYRIKVIASTGGGWYMETLDPDSVETPHLIKLPMVAVRGSVKLAEKPLAAKIFFGGEHGAVSVPFESDNEGAFAGYLPQLGDWWEVTVISSDPPVRRTLRNVRVELVAVDEPAFVEIALPGTVLTGEVVDQKSKPLEGALITARVWDSSEPLLQTGAGEGGLFRLEGLPAGKFLLRAQARPDLTSDVVTVQIEDGEEHAPIRLVAKSDMVVKGQVVSSRGPVPAAAVEIYPCPNPALFLLPAQFSDGEGYFRAPIPAGTREVVILVKAPGFSLRMFRTGVSSDQTVTIPLDQVGGRLNLELAQRPQWAYGNTLQPYVYHSGAWLPLTSLMRDWDSVAGGVDPFRVSLSGLEAGTYTACLATAAHWPALLGGAQPGRGCASGSVPYLGELSLRLAKD